mgnify:CR=1
RQELDLFYKNVIHKKYCCIYSPQGDSSKQKTSILPPALVIQLVIQLIPAIEHLSLLKNTKRV